MKRFLLYFLSFFVLTAFAVYAQSNVTALYLQNAGFDSNFNYGVNTVGNIAGDVISNVHGWNRDMNATFTVAGTFAFGSGATFNGGNPIPASGFLGSTGGALALSTGWGVILNYSQNVTLKGGRYAIATAYFNTGNATVGNSIVGWVPGDGQPSALSRVDAFPLATWFPDTIRFNVQGNTRGKIQAGFASRSGVGSVNNARILIDYVHLIYFGIERSELPPLIAEAETLYGDGSGTDAHLLLALINEAKRVLNDQSADVFQIADAYNDLFAGIAEYKLSNASETTPINMTDRIVNPSFESSFSGWTNSGLAIQNNTAFPLKHGTNYAERWVNRGSRVPDVSVQQLITNLPNGRYRLTAAAGNIQQSATGGTVNATANPQTGAQLFAGNRSVAVDTFLNRSVSFVVFDNQVLIGFRTVNATGNWVTLDNFRLMYEGNRPQFFVAAIDQLRMEAQALLPQTMQNIHRQNLVAAIDQAQQTTAAEPLVFQSMQAAHKALQESIDAARTSIRAYGDLLASITAARNVYGDGSANQAQALLAVILEAEQITAALQATVDQVNAANANLNTAVFAFRLANATGTVPGVVTNPNFARGATAAFGRSTITGVPIANLLEHGFCWSTHPEPTVMDNRSTRFFTNNGNVYHIQNLQPSTVYYMRAYAITRDFAVGYGEVIRVITIPRGTITYQLNASVTNAEGHHERIAEAIRTAVNFWNNLTSIQGLRLSVNFHTGTPTAEASYGGYIQFGANPSFQRTGTALHEMGHNIGVGQHSMWFGPNSPLRAEGSRGVWLGERANNVLRFLDNNPTATMTGDAVHMWPYGINGAHEDTGSEFLYIANSLITQGLGEDGLPPTGGFATPAYTFPSLPGVKYYLKSEGPTTGRASSYLIIDQAGRLANVQMRSADALVNDSAAWFLDFNPVNSFYRIRNVATGRFFSFVQSGVNGITLVQRTTPGAAEHFQLMGSRINTQIGSGSNTFTGKGYWIVRPQHTLNPPTLVAQTTATTTVQTFNFANTATSQRWFIMTEADVNAFERATVTSTPPALSDEIASIKIYSHQGKLNIDNIPAGSNVEVFDVSGRIVHRAEHVTGSCSFELQGGIYIVNIRNRNINVSRKVQM